MLNNGDGGSNEDSGTGKNANIAILERRKRIITAFIDRLNNHRRKIRRGKSREEVANEGQIEPKTSSVRTPRQEIFSGMDVNSPIHIRRRPDNPFDIKKIVNGLKEDERDWLRPMKGEYLTSCLGWMR